MESWYEFSVESVGRKSSFFLRLLTLRGHLSRRDRAELQTRSYTFVLYHNKWVGISASNRRVPRRKSGGARASGNIVSVLRLAQLVATLGYSGIKPGCVDHFILGHITWYSLPGRVQTLLQYIKHALEIINKPERIAKRQHSIN